MLQDPQKQFENTSGDLEDASIGGCVAIDMGQAPHPLAQPLGSPVSSRSIFGRAIQNGRRIRQSSALCASDLLLFRPFCTVPEVLGQLGNRSAAVKLLDPAPTDTTSKYGRQLMFCTVRSIHILCQMKEPATRRAASVLNTRITTWMLRWATLPVLHLTGTEHPQPLCPVTPKFLLPTNWQLSERNPE